MSDISIARVHYFERQFLRTQDFTDEQAYHVAMRRRHNIAHHIWGIVTGLAVIVDADSNLSVLSGMAVDGYGRELILQEQQQLSPQAFDDKGSDVLDVWLVYSRLDSDQAPRGYGACGNGDGQSFYRSIERPLIRLDVPDPAYPHRQPKGIPDGDLNFDPSRTPPDNLSEAWPVFLGQILRVRPNPGKPYVYSVNLADRPYVGLRAEEIVAASKRARVQIGAELETDTRRFAVFVPEADPGADPLPRFNITKGGTLDIRGQTTLDGNLTLAGKAIEFHAGTASSAQPWRIYHHSTDQTQHELRVEMAPPVAGAPGQNQVVFGTWSADKKQFLPCLTIADNCTVTVHGKLVVEGGIDLTRAMPPNLSAEVKNLLVASYFSGVSGANVLQPRFYPGSTGGVKGVSPIPEAMPTPAAVQEFAATLTDPDRMTAFAKEIKNDPQLLKDLRAALRK